MNEAGGSAGAGSTARRKGRREGGAAAVELAIVLPVLALLIFGIIEFGRGYNARIQLTAAVREGARTAALGGDDVEVETRTKDAATGLDASDVAVTVDPVDGCDAASNPVDVAVNATYPFSFDIPFFGSSTITLNATGVMRCGG